MLTIIVIAKNEELMIGDCLKSIQFADEIIVIDNGSTDNTAKISIKFKAKVFKTNLSGWDHLHNLGSQKANGNWILYIDADERVSGSLKKQIQKITSFPKSDYSAYCISRQNNYLGKQMKYGGWGDDSVIRLFEKSKLFGWFGSLHEQPRYSGNLGKIIDPIIHYSHRDLYSMTEKTIIFTNYEAQNRINIHHPPVIWWRFIRVMLSEFYLRFIKLSAWKDGSEGIIDGIFQIYNSFIIYSRLWELQNDQNQNRLHL